MSLSFARAFGRIAGSSMPDVADGHLPEEPEHAHLYHLATSHTGQVAEQPHHQRSQAQS